jgi:hypothetical protein
LARWLFVGCAYTKGWAHHTKEMLFNTGLDGTTAEVRVGDLGNALLRHACLLSAPGVRTGDMSMQESETMFRDQAFQDPAKVRHPVARGTHDPGHSTTR